MTQHPRHGERMSQHPRHGDGANCTKKHSSPAKPILGDHSTTACSRYNCSPRSILTVDQVETLRQGEHNRGWWEGYFYAVRETTARLRNEHAHALEDAEYRGMTKQLNRRESQMMASALRDAAIADRCPTCSHVLPFTTGHDDTEGAR